MSIHTSFHFKFTNINFQYDLHGIIIKIVKLKLCKEMIIIIVMDINDIKNRRVKNELKRINREYKIIKEGQIQFYDKGLDITIDILYTKEYPFKPFRALVNNKQYTSLLVKRQCNNTIKKMTNIHCLCCASITCPNNWVVSLKFLDILNEINLYLNYIIRAKSKVIASIIEKYYYYPEYIISSYL